MTHNELLDIFEGHILYLRGVITNQAKWNGICIVEEDDYEEILQEAFYESLEILEGRQYKKLRENETSQELLTRITKNAAERKFCPHKEQCVEDIEPKGGSIEISEELLDKKRELEKREEAENRVVEELPFKKRVVYMLHKEYGAEKASQLTGLSKGNIRVIKHRVQKKIDEWIEKGIVGLGAILAFLKGSKKAIAATAASAGAILATIALVVNLLQPPTPIGMNHQLGQSHGGSTMENPERGRLARFEDAAKMAALPDGRNDDQGSPISTSKFDSLKPDRVVRPPELSIGPNDELLISKNLKGSFDIYLYFLGPKNTIINGFKLNSHINTPTHNEHGGTFLRYDNTQMFFFYTTDELGTYDIVMTEV